METPHVVCYGCRLSYAEGDSDDDFAAEAVLEAVEDFLAAVADDFGEPHAAIDGDEQGSFAQTHGLGVGDDVGIDEAVPDFDDFDFGAAAIDAQIFQEPGYQRAGGFGAVGAGDFFRREICATPGRKHALASRACRWAERRDASGQRRHGLKYNIEHRTSNIERRIKTAFGERVHGDS